MDDLTHADQNIVTENSQPQDSKQKNSPEKHNPHLIAVAVILLVVLLASAAAFNWWSDQQNGENVIENRERESEVKDYVRDKDIERPERQVKYTNIAYKYDFVLPNAIQPADCSYFYDQETFDNRKDRIIAFYEGEYDCPVGDVNPFVVEVSVEPYNYQVPIIDGYELMSRGTKTFGANDYTSVLYMNAGAPGPQILEYFVYTSSENKYVFLFQTDPDFNREDYSEQILSTFNISTPEARKVVEFIAISPFREQGSGEYIYKISYDYQLSDLVGDQVRGIDPGRNAIAIQRDDQIITIAQNFEGVSVPYYDQVPAHYALEGFSGQTIYGVKNSPDLYSYHHEFSVGAEACSHWNPDPLACHPSWIEMNNGSDPLVVTCRLLPQEAFNAECDEIIESLQVERIQPLLPN